MSGNLSADVCFDGSPWDDSPEGVRAWSAWFDSLSPIMTEAEFQEWERERIAERRQQKALAAEEADRIATIFS